MKFITRLLILTFLLAIMVSAAGAQAVITTPVATTTAASAGSTVAIYYVACEDRGVVNFTGQMLTGYDVYYQLYSGPGGTGTALSGLRRAAVDGAYAYSEVVTYSGGTVPSGSTGSAKVTIARETNSASTTYETTVNDLQDGCSEPQNALGSSTDLGGNTAAVTYNSILSPFGGVLNPGYSPSAPKVVVIGARDYSLPRQETAGLIFAECNQFPIAEPGIIYDTDRVVIFWSWYAKTAEQLQQHIDNVNYEVQYFGSPFMQPVVRTPIQKRGADWFVFYYLDLGAARPDTYYIGYRATWNNPITDGYDDFGPGTGNEELVGNCDFTVLRNPANSLVDYRFP